MSHLAQVPLWAAILVSVLVTLGSGLTLLGTIGLVQLSSFYDRIHAPTLGTSWGTLGIMLASALLFSVTGTRIAVHELIIGVLVMTTTPATMMILGRAALFRGAQSGGGSLPGEVGRKPDTESDETLVHEGSETASLPDPEAPAGSGQPHG